jgi:hypothetical protein
MNFARVAASALAAWAVSIPIGYIVNDILLKDVYTANAAAFRPEEAMMANMPLGMVSSLVGFFGFAYMYAKGYEGTNGTMEGVRFGVLVAILLSGFSITWQYVLLPISGALTAAWIVDAIAEFALYGAIVGAIYRPLARRAQKVAPV